MGRSCQVYQFIGNFCSFRSYLLYDREIGDFLPIQISYLTYHPIGNFEIQKLPTPHGSR